MTEGGRRSPPPFKGREGGGKMNGGGGFSSGGVRIKGKEALSKGAARQLGEDVIREAALAAQAEANLRAVEKASINVQELVAHVKASPELESEVQTRRREWQLRIDVVANAGAEKASAADAGQSGTARRSDGKAALGATKRTVGAEVYNGEGSLEATASRACNSAKRVPGVDDALRVQPANVGATCWSVASSLPLDRVRVLKR